MLIQWIGVILSGLATLLCWRRWRWLRQDHKMACYRCSYPCSDETCSECGFGRTRANVVHLRRVRAAYLGMAICLLVVGAGFAIVVSPLMRHAPWHQVPTPVLAFLAPVSPENVWLHLAVRADTLTPSQAERVLAQAAGLLRRPATSNGQRSAIQLVARLAARGNADAIRLMSSLVTSSDENTSFFSCRVFLGCLVNGSPIADSTSTLEWLQLSDSLLKIGADPARHANTREVALKCVASIPIALDANGTIADTIVNSPRSSVRLAAIELVRARSWEDSRIITALRRAESDSDSEVSDAARQAIEELQRPP